MQTRDYIHANFVGDTFNGVPDKRKFICCQGPLDSTIPDFWHMVYQENVHSIAMLCGRVEQGRTKCADYWPLKARRVQPNQ